MNRNIKYVFLLIIILEITLFRYNTFAATAAETSPRPFTASTNPLEQDAFDYPFPSDSMLKTIDGVMEIKVDSRDLLLSAPNQWREDQVLARADRDRANGWTYNIPIMSGGEATGYTTESTGPIKPGDPVPLNPNKSFTYGYTVYPAEYGLTKFTGYTFVTGSKMGVKRGSIYTTGAGNSIEFKRTGEHSGDIFRQDGWFVIKDWFSADRWGYLGTNSADGNPWGHVWDVWGEDKSWDEGGGSVTVTMAPDGSSAYITRTYNLGANGYVNYPLYGGTIVEGGISFNEWQQIYGPGKNPSNTNSNQFWDSEKVRERRWYGVGERLWFFGIVTTDLVANSYVGQTTATISTTQLQIGMNVTNTGDKDYTGVEFKVEITGPQTFTHTFTSNIDRLSTANYSDVMSCGPFNPDESYTIKMTVNPNFNNPNNEIDKNNNQVTANLDIGSNSPPSGQKVHMSLRFKDMSGDSYKVDSDWGEGSDQIIVKSGYGIPIVGEITDFDYPSPDYPAPSVSEPCGQSYSIHYSGSRNYQIEECTAKINTGSLGFQTSPTGTVISTDQFDTTWINNLAKKARFALKIAQFPQAATNSYRKIYASPRQSNGQYTVEAIAEVKVSWIDDWDWTGSVHDHHSLDSSGDCTSGCNHGHQNSGTVSVSRVSPKTEKTFTDQKASGTVIILGSMFDDDQQVIKK